MYCLSERGEAESECAVSVEDGTRPHVRSGAFRQTAIQSHSGRRDPRASP